MVGVVMGGITYRLEVYLWAVTFGGKGRGRPKERRIQLTGIEQFTLKAGVRTILGGWSDEAGVFAFWDVRRHLGFRAGSPSLQISLDTLEHAASVGMSTEVRNVREGEEIAVAVQPDYLMWYLQEYERLYDCGGEVKNAAVLVEGKPEDERAFIDTGEGDAAQSRRHQVVSVVRNFREARFRPLVLRAYGYRCCLTGVALRLVDAAHVVPVSDPTSTDEPKNGIALNPLLHRAYDCGLLGFLPGGKTGINDRVLKALKRQKLDAGFDYVRRMIPASMTMPCSPEFHPPDDYFIRGLKARGWLDAEIGMAG
ncbi:MAG: HNH endonuclease signature motif containing protein [Phycisphaeraceae bacterium]